MKTPAVISLALCALAILAGCAATVSSEDQVAVSANAQDEPAPGKPAAPETQVDMMEAMD